MNLCHPRIRTIVLGILHIDNNRGMHSHPNVTAHMNKYEALQSPIASLMNR